MASNSENIPAQCGLCKLEGHFVASDPSDPSDPIMEIVKAAGVKILPWGGRGTPLETKNWSFRDLWKQMDKSWQSETFIDLGGDKKHNNDKHERARRSENGVTQAIR